jgi:hypothetical protein
MTSEEAFENFLEFNSKLEIINNNTSKEDKKRIHYKSLRNFIYHYNSSKKGKTKCTELLKEYLELIEKQNYYFTEEQSKAAYDFYIGPLAQDFYSRYVNFSAAFSIISFVLLLGIPVYFTWLIFHSKIILIAMLVLYFIYYVNYFLKYSSKKIYGYRY